MSHEGHQDTTSPTVAQLQYVWDEYKYRHDLCWRTVYKVSFAVVFLAVIPYVKDDLTTALEYSMLVPAGLGIVLSIFGIFLVWNELEALAKTKTAYRHLQNQFWDCVIKADEAIEANEVNEANKVKENAKHCKYISDKNDSRWKKCYRKGEITFDGYVILYLILLAILSICNFAFLGCSWIPSLIPN